MIPEILLRHIKLKDERFRVSHSLRDDILFSSIKKIGIVHPVVLTGKTPPYITVTGFRRLDSAKRLGLKSIPAIIVRMSEKDTLLFAIHDNITRGLNIVEKSLCLKKMFDAGCSREEITGIMQIFSLGIHEKILSTMVSIASAEKEFRNFVVAHDLSMKTIECLLRFMPKERGSIIRSLSRMRFTDSLLREILEMLHLYKIKKGKFGIGTMRRAEGAYELRAALRKQLYPILSSLEKKFELIKKRAALPPDIDIKVDPFFEKEYIDITVRIRDNGEIGELFGKLDDIFKEGHIRSILELTKGRVR